MQKHLAGSCFACHLIPIMSQRKCFPFFVSSKLFYAYIKEMSSELQTVYDPYFITFYNVLYTSLPVMGVAFFDQVMFSHSVTVHLFRVRLLDKESRFTSRSTFLVSVTFHSHPVKRNRMCFLVGCSEHFCFVVQKGCNSFVENLNSLDRLLLRLRILCFLF